MANAEDAYPREAHTNSMKLLYYLADVFIDTFGITRPSPKGRTQAAFFILGLMVLTLLAVLAAGIGIHSMMNQ